MARKRVTGRFYVFLMLVAALVLFLFRDSIFGASEVVNVLDGAASDVRSAQAVIIRDELPATETQVTRVEYVADEHTLVKKNDIVAYVYSLEYSEKKLQELNRTRKNIQEYHKVVLGKELDSQLEVYDLNVKQKALELKKSGAAHDARQPSEADRSADGRDGAETAVHERQHALRREAD